VTSNARPSYTSLFGPETKIPILPVDLDQWTFRIAAAWHYPLYIRFFSDEQTGQMFLKVD